MRHRHPITWTLGVALALVLTAAPAAHALPPQLMVTGLAMLGWVSALVASLASLALLSLSRAQRLTSVISVTALVVLLGVLRLSPSTSEADPAQKEAPDTVVIKGAQAAEWLGDPRTLWIDVRTFTAYEAGHVDGALSVPLLLSSVFNPSALDTLASAPEPLSHLAPDPSLTPEAWAALPDHWYRGDLALVETVGRIEALTWRGQKGGTIDRTILYCYSGRTSTPLARLLRARGLPVHVVKGGVNVLPEDRITRRTTPSRDITALSMTPPPRAQLARWGRYAAPPAPLPKLADAPPIVLNYEGREAKQRAEWTAALLTTWGYPEVRLKSDRATGAPSPRSSLRPWWWATLALLLGLTAVGPRLELARRLAGQPTNGMNRVLSVLQLVLLLGLQLSTAGAFGDESDAPLSLQWLPRHSEALRAMVALAMLHVMLRPRGHQLINAIDAARQRFGSPALEPWPWPRLHPGPIAVSVTAGLCVGWVAPPIALTVAGLLLTERFATWAWGRRLIQRVANATDTQQAAVRFLRVAGHRASDAPVTAWLTTRREGEPARMTRVTAAHGDTSIGLWSDAPGALYAARIAATLGADITLGLNDNHDGWSSLKLLPPPPQEDMHAQLIEALWRAMRVGVRPEHWAAHCLNAARYDEVAPSPSPLTLDVLRRRMSPEGASGDAMRRFGWRRERTVTVQLGPGIFDLEPIESPRQDPGLIARLATRAISQEAIGTSTDTLHGLWRGNLARQSEECALAIIVATAEVTRRAAAAGVPAMPPLRADEPRRDIVDFDDHPAPYELDEAWEHSEVPTVALISPVRLAYGPGPAPLRRWRGLLRAAEVRRDALRMALITTTRRVATTLKETHGEAFSQARLHTLEATQGKVARRPSPQWGHATPLPGRLTIEELERLGTEQPAQKRGTSRGAPVGITARLIGTVTANVPPRPGEIAIVARAEPAAIMACPPGGVIITERGSPLSHAAVVARERGVPLVIGVAGALSSFQPGQRIAISTRGTITDAEEA
ncbi:MAG: PEP-utilizing enzyme [Myxococcota bacterium]